MIAALNPDLVHAVGAVGTMGVAAEVTARMGAEGGSVAWLFDVGGHPYLGALPKPYVSGVVADVEHDFMRFADAVVVSSDELAEAALRRWGRTAIVVRDAPIASDAAGGKAEPDSIRSVVGLTPETPLLAAFGECIAPHGWSVIMNALVQMPLVHVAAVGDYLGSGSQQALELANLFGVADRIHFVPPVQSHCMRDYLSSADLGIVCPVCVTGWCNVSVPTELAEFVNSGLPVVVNDLNAVSDVVERCGVGESQNGTASHFALVVGRVLNDRHRFTARISSSTFREEMSWQRQSQGLLRAYRSLSTRKPRPLSFGSSWDIQKSATALVPKELVAAQARLIGQWTPLGDTDVRLGIGPANYAGQAAAFATAVCRNNENVSAEVTMRVLKGRPPYPADVYFNSTQLRSIQTQTTLMRHVLDRYTHLVTEAFLPFFGRLAGDHLEDELPVLERSGINLAILLHGSEIRNPRDHMERHRHSHFHDAPEDVVNKFASIASRNQEVAAQSGLPVFVTTPDLLEDLPNAQWAPLVVDIDAWTCDTPVMRRRRPVVLHGPSARWTKGTDKIMPGLEALHRSGLIELRIAEGVDWLQMRELVQSADIVLDQFSIGSYGAFAVEAMAAGRPVVAYLSDHVQRIVGRDLPIIHTVPTSLPDAIEQLVNDRDLAVKVGADSVRFARTYHDGCRTAEILGNFLSS